MPFKSEKQRKYLWANEPEIARDWTDTYGSKIQKAKGGIMDTPRRHYFSGAYGQGAGDRGGDPRASAAENRAAGSGAANEAWSPGIGGQQHIPKKKTIRGIKPGGDGIQTLGPLYGQNKMSQLMSLAGNWKKWWSLPPEIKKALAGNTPIKVAHGFKTPIDKTKGFSEFRSKVLPTLDDWARGGVKGVKDFGKGLLQGRWNVPQSQGVFVGKPNVASTYATKSGMRGTPWATKGTDVVKGFIDPQEAKWSRSMLGHVQGVVPGSVANRFSDMGGKAANFMKAAPISGLSKFVGAAMPGLNIGLGATRAGQHFKEGDYGQALMAGISAVPGPIGWAGLAGEMGLGALSNLSLGDPNAPENTLVMNEGGIARLPFANGGFDTNLLDYYLQKDPLLDVYNSQGLLAEKNILPYSADPKGVRDPKWASANVPQPFNQQYLEGSGWLNDARTADEMAQLPIDALPNKRQKVTNFLSRFIPGAGVTKMLRPDANEAYGNVAGLYPEEVFGMQEFGSGEDLRTDPWGKNIVSFAGDYEQGIKDWVEKYGSRMPKKAHSYFAKKQAWKKQALAKIIKEEQAREATKIEQARNRVHENRIQNTGGWQSGMAADPGFMEGPAGSEAFSSRENLSDQMGSFNRGGLAGLWPR
jgi:hypothetical protein